ncbi:DUF4328 domain-containing protein [Streptomyces sp. LBL]|uniref:DUF4328 domain-containing protein n=1 Tax=Streptomyces sp. LBL TaxID=2940562 RepID=UPI0024747488|nr:DUF4328 domain-containing protein [Streptomyces sp. LBL]
MPNPNPTPAPVLWTARCAVAALGLAGVAWLARVVWDIRLAAAGQPASGPPDQGEGRHRPLTSLEDGYHAVNALAGGATVLCALLFLSWLWRVRDNARAFSGEPPRHSWLWMYLGWVLPLANLWIPRGLVVDIHHRSAPGKPLPSSVNWWWGLWLIGLLSGVGLMHTGDTDELIARAYTDVWMLLVSDVAIVGAAVAAVLVVRAVTAAQGERMAEPR